MPESTSSRFASAAPRVTIGVGFFGVFQLGSTSPYHLIPLGAEPQAMFAAVRDALTRLAEALGCAPLGYAPVDLCAEEHAEMLPVVSAIHDVVYAAIAIATGSQGSAEMRRPAASPGSAMAELEHVLGWISLPAPDTSSAYYRREYARLTRIGLVRDIGGEAFDARCRLVGGRRQPPSLYFEPLSPIATQAMLARRFIYRADRFQFAVDWPLLLDELEAATWAFSSWSSAPPVQTPPLDFRRWELRGSEWVVVERPSLLFGSTLSDVLARRPLNVRLRPRQCAMARALARSFSGVFTCESYADGVATFRGLHDGRVMTVMEHRMAGQYGPEWIAFGRLIPLGDGRHLRSDGMVFMSPNEARRTRAVECAQRLLASSLEPTLAAEGALTRARYGVEVPCEVPGWTDAAWARRQIAEFKVKWREFASSSAGSAGGRGDRHPELDSVLTGWLAALQKVADAPPSIWRDNGRSRYLRLESPNDSGPFRDN